MSLSNAPMRPPHHMKSVDQHIRECLNNKAIREKIAAAVGWKDPSSTASRVLSGGQGIQLEDLPPLLSECGLTVVDKRYLDWLQIGTQIGANCWCERNNRPGACLGV